jgi:hypothetical protein
MITRIVLDTNVIYSALAFDKIPEKVFILVTEGQNCTTYISTETKREIEMKLKSPKFLAYRNFDANQVSQVLRYYYSLSTLIDVQQKVNLSRDKKDNMFLELSEQINAHFLITGDKDLLSLKKVNETVILKPSAFVNYKRG